MRIAVSLLAVILLVMGFNTLARGDEDPAEMKKLKVRIADLEFQVKYLLSREQALTKYMLMNEQRAAGLDQVADGSKERGFTSGAFSPVSREYLLDGLKKMAESLRQDLPAITEEEVAFLQAVKNKPPAPKTGKRDPRFPHRGRK